MHPRSPSRPPRLTPAQLLLAAALLVALDLLSARVVAALSCPGDPGCCTRDADCDDGDACTVDRCGAAGCEHAVVDFDAVRTGIDGALATASCDRLPQGVTVGLGRARAFVDRAASLTAAGVMRPLARALARLRAAGRQSAAAGSRGRLSPGCAADLVARIDQARQRTTCLASAAGSGAPFACLSGSGPLFRLTGHRSSGYSRRALAPGSRIDARGAVFFASPSNHYPISLDGGAGICLAGGDVRGRYDRSLGWSDMHDMNNAAVAFASPTAVDGIRVDDVTDALRPHGIGPFTIRNVWLSYIRDDCVENDHLEGGLIEDSLFDGCYVALSERPSPNDTVDGRGNLVTIRRSLIRLQPMPGPRNGAPSALGNGEFFKWSDNPTRLALYDDVFMAERVGQGGPDTMGVPASLVDCARNVMVWLGPGDYPAPLPACFTVTKDRTVWDDAVARWKRDHPHVGQP